MKNFLENTIQLKASTNIERIVAIFPGRFQPFSKHHFKAYEYVKNEFGDVNTYISTSNNVKEDSPFNFLEKKQIMVEGYNINSKNIVECKQPYNSIEILERFNPETTACIYCVGYKEKKDNTTFLKKDGTNRYIQPFINIESLVPFSQHSYMLFIPHIYYKIEGYGELSGTVTRLVLGSGNSELFEQLMGWDNLELKEMICTKLKETFQKTLDEFIIAGKPKTLISEVSNTGGFGSEQDDGPRFMIGNMATFNKLSTDIAEKLGYTILNYILSGKTEFEVHDTEPPKGPTTAVSYFKTGVILKDKELQGGTDYEEDMSDLDAFLKWKGELENLAKTLGQELIDFVGAEYSIQLSPSNETPKA